MDSPRGRIYLVNQLLDGAELTPAAAEHFDRCLGCMACMTACPSGVQYDQLIEAARVWTEEALSSGPAPVQAPANGKRPVRDRIARAAIFSLFPYPKRLRAMTAPLRVAQRTGLDRRLARSSLPARVSPVLGAALRLAPPPVSAAAARPLPERVPALGTRDRKSTRLNSSHPSISYAVFCLKKKKKALSRFSRQCRRFSMGSDLSGPT